VQLQILPDIKKAMPSVKIVTSTHTICDAMDGEVYKDICFQLFTTYFQLYYNTDYIFNS